MAVPKMFQLGPGVKVRVVQKHDQPTGKLTTGEIAQILTRGDHPRGIKVRLVTGQIGRVQSLSYGDETNRSASVGEDSVGGGVLPPPSTGSSHRRRDNANSRHETSRKGRSRAERGECSQPPAANESVSLLDYVQRPRATPSSGTKSAGPASVPVQEQLEVDYPSLDSALIAAILVDYPNVEEARTVLASLG